MEYTIKAGDTLWALSRKNNTTVDNLMRLNPQIKNRNLIYTGRTLNLPDPPAPQPTSTPAVAVPPFVYIEPPVQTSSVGLTASKSYDDSDFDTASLMNLVGKVLILDNINIDADEIYPDFLPYLKNGNAISTHNVNHHEIFNPNRVGMIPDPVNTNLAYVFFTTPNLNLGTGKNAGKNIASDSFLLNLDKTEPYILSSLTQETSNFNSFIKLLTNRFLSFESKDIIMETENNKETWLGYKYITPINTIESAVADQFSVTYYEDKFLPITKLHKVWVDYMEKIRRGIFLPNPETTIARREFDYLCSAYYFLIEPDGMTISYFAKYTGVAPISLPYSSFGFKLGDNGNSEVAINYLYQFKEDMNPEILDDFNKASSKMSSNSGSVEVKSKKHYDNNVRNPAQPSKDYVLIFNENPLTD